MAPPFPPPQGRWAKAAGPASLVSAVSPAFLQETGEHLTLYTFPSLPTPSHHHDPPGPPETALKQARPLPYSLGRLGGGICRSEGSTPQMSRAYSVMVRSLENLPEQAMFLMTFLVHSLGFCRGKEKLSNPRYHAKTTCTSRTSELFPDELSAPGASLMNKEEIAINSSLKKATDQKSYQMTRYKGKEPEKVPSLKMHHVF